MTEQTKQYAIACYYSWLATCIYVGYVNSEKQLVVESEVVKKLVSVKNIAEYLKELDGRIWTNKHEPLLCELKGAGVINQIDFEGEQQAELQAIDDLFNSLKSEKRLILSEGIGRIQGHHKEMAFKILLKSLTKNLCEEPPVVGCSAIVMKRAWVNGRYIVSHHLR